MSVTVTGEMYQLFAPMVPARLELVLGATVSIVTVSEPYEVSQLPTVFLALVSITWAPSEREAVMNSNDSTASSKAPSEAVAGSQGPPSTLY